MAIASYIAAPKSALGKKKNAVGKLQATTSCLSFLWPNLFSGGPKIFFFLPSFPFLESTSTVHFMAHSRARNRALKFFFLPLRFCTYITCMGLYGHSAILVSRNGILKKPKYIMKEAKTVLIGSIRNEGALVRKNHHQSLFTKLKKVRMRFTINLYFLI